jgi:hypothetical protein
MGARRPTFRRRTAGLERGVISGSVTIVAIKAI